MNSNKHDNKAEMQAVISAKIGGKAINLLGYNTVYAKMFIEGCKHFHRANFEDFFWDVIIRFIVETANLKRYDGRNERAVNMAKKIVEAFPYLQSTAMSDEDKEKQNKIYGYLDEDANLSRIIQDLDDRLDKEAEKLAKCFE